MPRDRITRVLELEAVLAREEAWALREAVASMAGSLDTEVDSPPLLRMELDDDGPISTPGPSMLNRSWLHTSQSKTNPREAAEDVERYEEIREELLSKDCADDNPRCIDLIEYEV